MKILFYLPAITPWWFETLIAPMIRALYDEAEIHIIVAPVWCATGLNMRDVEPLSDLTALNWHIISADNPADFVMDGTEVEGLLDLVNAINPDLTLARSADRRTPGFFPGMVRYIMEHGCHPFHTPYRGFVLEEQPFYHGVMPAHVAKAGDYAAKLLGPNWDKINDIFSEPAPGDSRARLGLPADRPVLAIPLQYEHEENFFGIGSPLQYGPEFLEELLHALDPRIVLAVTDHPLNLRHLLRLGLEKLAHKYPDRLYLYPVNADLGSPTTLLIHAADAVLIDRSKCVTMAAFFGTPIIHIGDSVLAGWMNATPLAAVTADGMANRGLPAPDATMARRWFGWHLGTRLVNPNKVTLKAVLDRVHYRTDDDETAASIAYLQPWCDAAMATARQVVAKHPALNGPGQLVA